MNKKTTKQLQILVSETYTKAYSKGASDTCMGLILTLQNLYSDSETLTINQIIVICQSLYDEIEKKK